MKLIFDDITFHDCPIHSLGFDSDNYELLFDLDLILKWHTEKSAFRFSICPVTMVFKNVYDVSLDIVGDTQLIMNDVSCENPRVPKNIDCLPFNTLEYNWLIDLIVGGEIQFTSIGLTIYQRKEAMTIRRQKLTMEERGGFSLAKEGEIILEEYSWLK